MMGIGHSDQWPVAKAQAKHQTYHIRFGVGLQAFNIFATMIHQLRHYVTINESSVKLAKRICHDDHWSLIQRPLFVYNSNQLWLCSCCSYCNWLLSILYKYCCVVLLHLIHSFVCSFPNHKSTITHNIIDSDRHKYSFSNETFIHVCYRLNHTIGIQISVTQLQ